MPCAPDPTHDDVLRLSALRQPWTRANSPKDDDDDVDRRRAGDAARVRDAARGKKREVQAAGRWLPAELYRFALRRAPAPGGFEFGLIEAQRSTLCLVVAHMLLGARLPRSIPTKAFLDEKAPSSRRK